MVARALLPSSNGGAAGGGCHVMNRFWARRGTVELASVLEPHLTPKVAHFGLAKTVLPD